MRKALKISSISIILVAFLVLALLIFLPRSYPVPSFQPDPGGLYWELETGSKIGYYHFQPDSTKLSTPIIYLHGGPGGPIRPGHRSFLQDLAGLGYEVYAYDQLGCGHSSRLEDISGYTVQRQVEDLEQIIGQLGGEKVILMGHSWGGMLAARFIALHPEKVKAAIFSCPGPMLPIRPELAKTKAPDSLGIQKPAHSNAEGNRKAANLRTRAMIWLARHQNLKLASDEEADNFATYLNQFLDQSTQKEGEEPGEPVPGAGFYVQVKTAQDFSNAEDLRAQTCGSNLPVLVLKGQFDNQPWGYTNEYLTCFPNYQLLLIPDAGHALYSEKPVEYVGGIDGFLSGLVVDEEITDENH